MARDLIAPAFDKGFENPNHWGNPPLNGLVRQRIPYFLEDVRGGPGSRGISCLWITASLAIDFNKKGF